MMRAAVLGPDGAVTVRDVDPPVPAPDQVLVRVRAAGLNRADLSARASSAQAGFAIAGLELAGEVETVGAQVSRWRPGDKVMGRGSGFAELAVLGEADAIRVPDGLSWEEAGAMPVTLLTAHDALVTNGRLQQGDLVVVNAGSSGVGICAARMAGILGAGAVVSATTSTSKTAAIRAAVGPLACPLVVVDVSGDDFVAAVRGQSADGQGAHLIIDNVGASVLADNVGAARITGRIVQVGRLGGRHGEIDLDELARKRLTLVGVTFRTRSQAEGAEVARRCVEDLGHQLARFRPRIDASFPLAQILDARAAMLGNAHVGKIVVIP
jgi:NADPH:quinone reductase-like Zn-dependent oxidoreductase